MSNWRHDGHRGNRYNQRVPQVGINKSSKPMGNVDFFAVWNASLVFCGKPQAPGLKKEASHTDLCKTLVQLRPFDQSAIELELGEPWSYVIKKDASAGFGLLWIVGRASCCLGH